MSDDKDNIVNLEEIRKSIEKTTKPIEVYSNDDPYLTLMNKNHAFIHSVGGKPLIMSYVFSEVFNRNILEFISPESLLTRYCNQTVQVNKQSVALGKWWLQHAERREYNTIIFDPSKPKEYNRCLNLWEGFTIKPKYTKFGWKHTFKHIYKILCNKNAEKFKYTIKWLAWCVQNPSERAEVSIIFKGKQGAGKGLLFTFFTEIFGQHAMSISNRELLTGKHNGHFSRVVFLFADEAYYPGDKEVEGVMKELITQPKIPYRAMYREAVMGANRLHIVQSTNSEWVIPADDDTRRYFINAVDNKYAKGQINDLERKLYFSRIYTEMNNGGKEAMLYDLLNLDVSDWHPRDNIPLTEELEKQKKLSRSKLASAIFEFIDDGVFPGVFSNEEYLIDANELWELLNTLEPVLKNTSLNKKAEAIKDIGVTKRRGAKGNKWIFPDLASTKRQWENKYGKTKWSENIKEWLVVKAPY